MKKKAIILDFNILAEENLSVHELLALYDMYYNIINKEFINSLQKKGFIKIKENEESILLREKAKLLIEFLEIESLDPVKENKVIKKSIRVLNIKITDNFVDEYRNKWKGLKPGSMGSFSSCKDKLIRWLSNNPNYESEQILKAADIYLNSIQNYQYLQQADFFIYKKEGKDEHSRLSAFIDEIETKSEGWTSTLK